MRPQTVLAGLTLAVLAAAPRASEAQTTVLAGNRTTPVVVAGGAGGNGDNGTNASIITIDFDDLDIDLFVPARDAPLTRTLDVVRAGTWFAHPAPGGEVAPGVPPGVSIDGRAVGEGGIALAEGSRVLRAPAGGPPFVLSPLPRDAFVEMLPVE